MKVTKFNRVLAILGEIKELVGRGILKGTRIRIHVAVWEMQEGDEDNMDLLNEWDITDIVIN